MLNRVNAPAGLRRAEPGSAAPWEHARKAPRPRFEVAITVFMLLATITASLLFAGDMIEKGIGFWDDRSWIDVGRLSLFAVIVLILGYGNLVYQFSRLGYYVRLRRHRPIAYDELVQATAGLPAPPVVVLVPSFREDPRTIRQTLLSAALQDYSNRRVVLLLDDPPLPTEPEFAVLLESARQAPAEIMDQLAEPAGRAQTAYEAFLARVKRGGFEPAREIDALFVALAEADAWLAAQAAGNDRADHTDDLFVALTYEGARSLLAQTMRRLLATQPADQLTFMDLDRDFRRLADLFQVEISAFERKRYANLSWEPNKAANLNAYLGVVGRRVQEVERDGALYLEFVGPDEWGHGSVVVPDATYVLTLDADSLLSPDYARRLVGLMEAPGNERVAVAQTPYSAIPNPPGVLERIAGATTDLQYVVHQGFTWCNATFWVGANALLRKQALDEIRTDETERGFRVPKYIQDRTVIEDTESTVDLVSPRLGTGELPGTAGLQRHPARFRLAADPAATLGERRSACPAEAVALRADASSPAGSRAAVAGDPGPGPLPGLDLWLVDRPLPAPLPAGGSGLEQCVVAPYRHPVLPALLARSAPGRVSGGRHPAGLRLQYSAAADQSGRGREVDPAGLHWQEDPVRADAEGGGPHGGAALGGALRVAADGLLRDRGGVGLHRRPGDGSALPIKHSPDAGLRPGGVRRPAGQRPGHLQRPLAAALAETAAAAGPGLCPTSATLAERGPGWGLTEGDSAAALRGTKLTL